MTPARTNSRKRPTRRNSLRELDALEKWAKRAELSRPLGLNLALGIYDLALAIRKIDRATRKIIADQSKSARQQGDLLNSLWTLVYSALPPHVKDLRKPLDQAIRKIYAEVDVDEETLDEEFRRSSAATKRRWKRQDPVRERSLEQAKKSGPKAGQRKLT